MLRLDISTLIFFYIAFSVIAILIIWAFWGYRRIKRPDISADKEEKSIWKCSVCFFAYIDSRHEDISVCPQCGSYNKREDGG